MIGVTSIAAVEDQMVVTFRNIDGQSQFLEEVFLEIAKVDVNLDMISLTTSEDATCSFSFTTSNRYYVQVGEVLGAIRRDFPEIKFSISDGYAKLVAEGEEMQFCPGVAAAVIAAVKQSGASIAMITTSETDISLLLPAGNLSAAKAALEG